MCKIVTFTNSKLLDTKKTSNKVGNILLNIERDGYGYAVQGLSGVYGEKCISDSFKSRIDLKLMNPTDVIKKNYESFGTKSKPTGPMILHGRTSTNDFGLENCHPMIKDNHYLIHNGVVTDHGPYYEATTTNDSEHVLTRFIEGIESVEKHLSGYYAFTCIDDQGLLHVVRDDSATLYMAWIDKLDTFIIATTESLITSVTKSLNVEVTAIDEVREDIYMIFNGNELIHKSAIEPRGWTSYESSKSMASLGKSLDDGGWTSHKPVKENYAHMEEEAFIEAIQFVDGSCEILNRDDRTITSTEFHILPLTEQKECWIVFPTGAEIDYWSRLSAS